MHGIILCELQRYGRARLGASGWNKVLEQAQLGGTTYLMGASYPDEHVIALVQAAAGIAGQPPVVLLEDFGEFIAPTLVTIYKPLVKPDWKTLDVIEHAEASIHAAVRRRETAATPPRLAVRRESPTVAVLTYSSQRRMCAVAKGIARGLAKHYGERLTISEGACMATGAPACLIRFQVG